MSPALEVTRLSAGYGQILVVRDAELVVEPGTVAAIVGANGAGKSTLLKAIAGLIPARGGKIAVAGFPGSVERLPAHRRVGLGVALVQENKRIFRDMSVADNLLVAAGRLGRIELQARKDNAFALFPVLAEKSKISAGSLSGGQQQMLAIAQALVSKPRILMLDEPSAGLAPILVRQVMDTARAIAGTGVAVVLVEQVLREALRIADDLYTMTAGVLKQDPHFVRGESSRRLDDLYFRGNS